MDPHQEAKASLQSSTSASPTTSGTAAATATATPSLASSTNPTEPQVQSAALSEAEKAQLIDGILKTVKDIISSHDAINAYAKVRSTAFDDMISDIATYMQQQDFSSPLFHTLDELLQALCQMGHNCTSSYTKGWKRAQELDAEGDVDTAELIYEDALDDKDRAACFRAKAKALLDAVRDHYMYPGASRTAVRVGIIVTALEQYAETLRELEKEPEGESEPSWGSGRSEVQDPESGMDGSLRHVGGQFD